MNNETEQIFLLNQTESQPSATPQKAKESGVAPQDVEDFSTVCRTCATVTEFVIPIFEGEGLQNNLAEKIHKHLPIQVSEKDILPRVVCYQCASTLLAWHELVQCCVQADTALRTRLAVAAATDSARTKGIENTTESKSSSKEIIQNSEQEENKWDARIKVENTFALFDSSTCDDTQYDNQANSSNESNEEDDEPLSNIASNQKATKSESSDVYENFYNALVNFRNHFVNEHSSNKVKCPEPNASSDSEIASEDEKDDEFNVDRYDDLTDCNMRKDRMDEETRSELSRVQTKINGKVFYTCQICGKNLSSSHTYVFHKRIHTGERPCVCHVCGKQFRAPNGLQRHLTETHERMRRHVCSVCCKNFANSQNLKQHLRIHTGERPFVCVHCGKRFTQSGSLHVHLKTHTEQFPHQCAECGAKFRLRSGLVRHNLKHTGERPHVCVFCGKSFRQRHELTNHGLSHTDAKPYSCVVCGAAFRQRRALRHHNKRVHEVEIDVPPREITHPIIYTHVANY